MLPTITIVTPSYNQGQFLEEAISSILAQNYPRLQYLVIDGGSMDGSREVMERYASRLDYAVSEKDGGQSDALKRGFARATGELLGWVNSDDVLLPGALQVIGEAFERNPGCLIAGDVSVFTEGRREESRIIRQRNLNSRDMVAGWSGRACYSQPGVFFPRAAYVESGGIDESLQWGMDQDLMIRMLRTHRVAYVKEVVAAARLHPGAKTCAQAGNQIAEAFRVHQRYWKEVPHPTAVCRLLSLMGLGRCALGRIYHRNPAALGPIISEMFHTVLARE